MELEDMEVSRVDLEQELRALVKDPNVVKKVIDGPLIDQLKRGACKSV